MRVHIHHREEDRFLGEGGEWVTDVKEARAFSTVREAADYCRARKMKKMELLILRPSQPPLTIRVKGQAFPATAR